MEQSTQWGVSLPNTFPMKKHLKSRNPALNIPRRHEAVATDTVFSDTPAVDSGVGSPQVLFLMYTLEIPQKLQHKFFALNFCYFYF